MTAHSIPAIDVEQMHSDRWVARWLFLCAGMVFAMAVIGAITRLTESGLSIMEWAPFTGALPPFSEAEWQRLFALYKQIPEFQQDNPDMTLSEFKEIFWWEYIHRLWGRLIGVVFALPFLWFLLRRRLAKGLLPHLLALLALGGLQGGLGWFMVASGFSDRTDVSQYRLVLHLGMAVVIYIYLVRVALGLRHPRREPSPDRRATVLRRGVLSLIALILLTMLSGGFVAGLNAGMIYNTFPLMDGRLVPAGYGALSPWILNLTENLAAVQFNHRVLAVATALLALALWFWGRHLHLAPKVRGLLMILAGFALVQLGLGIWTLLAVVPVSLGALHQAGALVFLTLALLTLFHLRPARGL